MRDAFVRELESLAEADPRIVALSGDIGNRMFDRFKERCPGRFFNCGVAEANMTGIAAGMALAGLRPVTYTIAAFNTVRCLEQIRVDLCYHNVPVVVAGVGAGLSYAPLGPTHHCCEDIALLRALPNMTVLCPADPVETRLALRAALAHDGPVYLRLGKKGEPNIHQTPPAFAIGQAIPVRDGADLCLLVTGTILPEALKAADLLAEAGIAARVLSVPTVKPLNTALLAEVFASFPLIATIEEHSLAGGFGSAVAEWLVDCGPRAGARLLRLALPDAFFKEAGSQEHAQARLGLDAPSMAARLRAALSSSKSGV
jgi:transketolase